MTAIAPTSVATAPILTIAQFPDVNPSARTHKPTSATKAPISVPIFAVRIDHITFELSGAVYGVRL